MLLIVATTTIIAVLSVMVGYTALKKGEMDLQSFMFAEAASLIVKDVFPARDLANLREVREFLESQTAVSLCMEYKVKCKNDASSYNASQIPVLDFTKDHVLGNPGTPIRLYYPHKDHEEPLGVLLWLHGGGFVLGSVEADDYKAALLANRTDLAVVSVDYRLAPEHPYPAGLDDASDVLTWLLEAEEPRERFNLRADRVFIGGESAGATLALAAVLKNLGRSSNSDPVRGMLLVYPPLDMNYSLESYIHNAKTNGVLTDSQMAWFWQLYGGKGNATMEYCLDSDPLFCPGLASPDLLSHPSFPSTYLHLAVHDILYSEGMAFADQLKLAQGTDKVQVSTYQHSVHGFFFVSMFPEHAAAIATATRQLVDEYGRLEAA